MEFNITIEKDRPRHESSHISKRERTQQGTYSGLGLVVLKRIVDAGTLRP